jgi:hypothetical protein
MEGLSNDDQKEKLILIIKSENELLFKRCMDLIKQRNQIKDEVLVAKQMLEENEVKIDELQMAHDLELHRLIELNERKEYSLQFLEQRLVDIEHFLRNWGQKDPYIRDQLKIIKVNPDLKKIRITSVVEENDILKKQLKEAYDKIEMIEGKEECLTRRPSTQSNFRDHHTDLRFDQSPQIPKLDFSKLGKQVEFTMTQELKEKDEERKFVDNKKFKVLAEKFPEEYQSKLEANIEILQEEVKELEKANKVLKAKVRFTEKFRFF